MKLGSLGNPRAQCIHVCGGDSDDDTFLWKFKEHWCQEIDRKLGPVFVHCVGRAENQWSNALEL